MCFIKCLRYSILFKIIEFARPVLTNNFTQSAIFYNFNQSPYLDVFAELFNVNHGLASGFVIGAIFVDVELCSKALLVSAGRDFNIKNLNEILLKHVVLCNDVRLVLQSSGAENVISPIEHHGAIPHQESHANGSHQPPGQLAHELAVDKEVIVFSEHVHAQVSVLSMIPLLFQPYFLPQSFDTLPGFPCLLI